MALTRFHRAWVVGLACLPLIGPAASNEGAAEQVVRKYLELVAARAKEAETLLTPNATYVVYDLAGPMADEFPVILEPLRQASCPAPILQNEGKTGGNEFDEGEVVRVEWRCTKSPADVSAPIVVRFFVVAQKIAAAAFEDPPGYEWRTLPE